MNIGLDKARRHLKHRKLMLILGPRSYNVVGSDHFDSVTAKYKPRVGPRLCSTVSKNAEQVDPLWNKRLQGMSPIFGEDSELPIKLKRSRRRAITHRQDGYATWVT